jgi:hypothetical protein
MRAKLERIGEHYRVAVKRDGCGDPVIPGRNGHLFVDAGLVCVCFTDDGRKKPFTTKLFKTARLKMLPGMRLTQDGDYEFIGEIPESLVWTALFRALRVKRFKRTKGQPRPLPPGLLRYQRERRENAPGRVAGARVGVGYLPGPSSDFRARK